MINVFLKLLVPVNLLVSVVIFFTALGTNVKVFIVGILSTLLFLSCGVINNKVNYTVEEKLENLQKYLAEGVILENERPMVDILSEQEVLLKAADYALSEGFLDPSCYIYEMAPELLVAKIEAPVLVHFPDGKPVSYMLSAVDEMGVLLMYINVQCKVNSGDNKFVFHQAGPNPSSSRLDGRTDEHYISKREVKEFTEGRFSGKHISEPIAIRGLYLEEDPHSRNAIFWYFRISDNNRSIGESYDEYIIDALIRRYNTSNKNNGNRSIFSNNFPGSPHLSGYRIARLVTPLNIFDSYSGSRMIDESPQDNYMIKPLKYIAVSLTE